MPSPQRNAPTCIDLFAGCGGFTLGMERAGFRVLAALDWDKSAVETLSANLASTRNELSLTADRVIRADIRSFAPSRLARLIGARTVDLIVGGPPCQGFSTARQVDGANHGKRLKSDARRFLYRDFLRYVEYFQPKVFVMENVLGIRSAGNGTYFTQVQRDARRIGTRGRAVPYRVHSQIEDSWPLGAPQKRRRQFIIGVRADLRGYFPTEFPHASRARPKITLGAAIGDLPVLRAGTGKHAVPYHRERRAKHLEALGATARRFLFDVAQVGRTKVLTNHVARPHSDRDLRDFRRLREGETSAAAIARRGQEFEFPYKKHHFKDRYTRQSRSKPCSTIVAHLAKDGLMFIHPTQNRTLTPREAARVQTFPDWFSFPTAQTHAFRLIGNAVPPIVAEALGAAVRSFFQALQAQNGAAKHARPPRAEIVVPPQNAAEAAKTLVPLAALAKRELRDLARQDLLKGWHTLLSLLPHLHPENARDHGRSVESTTNGIQARGELRQLLGKRYARSGWPVSLKELGYEAWRRCAAGDFPRSALYSPAY
jgi:DNA (cytosine-5)-methyltransferase 1